MQSDLEMLCVRQRDIEQTVAACLGTNCGTDCAAL